MFNFVRYKGFLVQLVAMLALAVPLAILGSGAVAAKGGGGGGGGGSGSPTFALTVTKAGTGTGTVTSSPAGISCGTTCSANFPQRTVVTLTATPAAGSTFAGWSGACTGTGTCSVTMNAAQSVTATFTATTFPLSVATAGTGTGTVTSSPAGINCGTTCSANFPTNTVVTLTASPAAGATFGGWSGACTGTAACSVTMSAAASVTATFNNPSATPPDLTIGQTASATSVASGGALSYTLKVSASGSNVAGVKVQDTLPSGATVTSVTPSAGAGFACSTAGTVVTCTGGSIAAGSSATIVVALNAPNVACGTSQTLSNAAVVDPDNTIVESNETNNTAAAAPVTATGQACLSEPPLTGHQIIGFPSRDFVSSTGWAANESLTLNVLRNDVVVGTAHGTADATGLFEVNHPGGFCWQQVTPDLRPGDVIRITHDATGAAEQTRVRNVTAGPATEVPAGSGTVVIHGTAQDAAGNPIPLGEIEERLIGSSANRFDLNGRRDLRAPGDGILAYDPIDPTSNPKGINWTATYHLSAADVTRALGAQSRILWLGPLGAASAELTIFEYGFGNGPTAGCIGNFAPPEVTAHANPPGGTYTAAQSVVLTHDDPAAVIFYTTDGTDPTTASRQYTAPIQVATSTTLKFMAMGASGMPDQIVKEVYTINPAP